MNLFILIFEVLTNACLKKNQICRAVNYLHRAVGVCHRDIKPQNLLVSISKLVLECNNRYFSNEDAFGR